MSEAALAIVEGRATPPATERGRCQSHARRVVDRALGFSVYSRYPVPKDPRYGDITAASAETAWKAAGLAVTDMQAGDLLYTAGDSPAGHVGIFLGVLGGKALVLENTTAARGRVVGAHLNIRLTEFSQFGPVRTVIRFPEDTKTADDRALNEANGTAPLTTKTEFLGLVGITQEESGYVLKLPDTPNYRDDPAWMFHTLAVHADRAPQAVTTNLGQVKSIVVLRTPYADEMEFAVPFLGPISVSSGAIKDTVEKHFRLLKQRFFRTEGWGAYYEPIYNLALSQDKGQYRIPIPGVTSISVRQEAGGNAVAEIELHIGEQEPAEMILSTLVMAQRLKNAMIEVWLPMTYYDPQAKGRERQILYPAFVGVPEEVTASPWPHGIRFRVVPQDHLMNTRGVNPADGVPNHWPKDTPLHQIVTDIGDAYKIKFWTPSAPTLGTLKQLQATTENAYNALYRPPLDVVREVVERAAGLRLARTTGFELFGRSIVPGGSRGMWMVYDPNAFHPFTKGFWANQWWAQVASKVAGVILGDPNVVGECAVFYPENLSRDPKHLKVMASILETYGRETARDKAWRKLVDTVSSILSVAGIGSGPAIKSAYEGEMKTALIEAVDSWFASGPDGAARIQKWLTPVLAVEEFVARTPSEAELANPVYGTPHGQVGQRVQRVSAEKAASLMQIGQAPDGGFYLQTPNGPRQFARKDSVYLYYSANLARPSLVVPVNRTPEMEDAEHRFYPYTVTLRCKPEYGVRVGQLAVVVGLGRLDGLFEIAAVNHSLNGSSQELEVVLRTSRDLLIV